MDTLVPLVRCMPDGVLSSQQAYHTAARIRRLVIHEIKVEGLLHISAPHKLPSLPGFEVLGILAEHVSLLGGDLLPNLRELVWDVNDPERSIYAPLLFSSCLVACRIWRENDIPVFLRELALRSPGVQLLHLPFSVDVDQISLPPSFHALRKLHVPMKEYSTLLDFASLQFLESLHWSPSSEQMLPRIHRSLTPYFPALRKLRLDVGPLDLHHVITFLHSIQTTSLRSFRLHISK
ncbi:hypothetical protein PHLCEN_2v10963 [Hermanssonia centrifuga]|uniref:Uncharacterized protein n=1 Tax=Hermanssonia centrifuga TaxID=98765 RepID=A0A2R6NLC5_9APHY|nr:hypothetical protein PHLCEN_2v10963 [Hermanssonia centrifuga]